MQGSIQENQEHIETGMIWHISLIFGLQVN